MSDLALERLDHFVLTVRDVALAFGHQKINVHPAGNGIRLVAMRPTPGSADVCFLTTTPVDHWITHLAACDVPLLEGPVRRRPRAG